MSINKSMEAIMKIELTPDEVAVLETLLHRAIAALPVEIHHCRTNEFKEYLKTQQTLIEKIADKLKQ